MITLEMFLAYPDHHHLRMITQGSLRREPMQCSLVLLISNARLAFLTILTYDMQSCGPAPGECTRITILSKGTQVCQSIAQYEIRINLQAHRTIIVAFQPINGCRIYNSHRKCWVFLTSLPKVDSFLILIIVPKMPNLSLTPLKPSCHPQHDMRDAVLKYASALLNK